MEYKLSDICSGITDGSHNPPAGISNSDYLMLSSKNIFDDEITFDAPRYLSEEQFVVENKRTRIKPGDILMTIVGTVGRTAIVPDGISTITLQRSVAVLHPLKDICFSRYLMYALRSKRKFFESEAHGVAQKGIYLKQLSNIIVDVPELERQEATVQILDFVQNIIKKRHEELDKLDELIKARFIELFGTYPANEKRWTAGTIRDLVTEVRYGSSRKAADGDSGKYPYLRMNNITYNGELDLTDTKTIDIPDEELEKCTVRRGDLLFNRTNSKELVGKTCVYNRDEMMVLAGFVVRVRLNDRALPEFVSAFMNTDFSKQMLLGMCKAAIGQANINAQELQNIGIYIPPLQVQKDFVSFKTQVDKSKYQAEPNSRKYHIHRLRKQYQELTDSLFLYFTKLFEVIILQKGICQTCIFQSFTIHAALS